MGQLVFQAALGGAVNLIGPNISATTNFTLPGADGTNGQALTTNGSGTLGFSSIVSGAAGSNTQVQFNNGGNFGASSSLTWSGSILTSTGFAGPLNGTVGATTANTGNFTTLTTSSTVTVNGGTANGVTYLNGSKVLTSGSALTFDGTNLGVGVTGTGGAYVKWLTDSTSNGRSWGIRNGYTNGGDFVIVSSSTNNDTLNTQQMQIQRDGTFVWSPAGTEALRLTSSSLYTASGINVGIGLSNPSSYGKFVVANTGGQNFISMVDTANGNVYGRLVYDNDYFIYKPNSGTAAFTVDPSGNFSVANNVSANGLGTFTATSANGARALKLIGRPTTNDSQIGFFANDGTTSQGFFNSSASKVAFFTASSLESVIFLADGRLRTYSTISVGDANPSTSGAGITFPATQSASSNANTLDDYEEGTWPISITFGGGSTGQTYDYNTGSYTKVGRLVTLNGLCSISNKGSSTGTAQLQTLPFPLLSGTSGYSAGILVSSGISSTGTIGTYSIASGGMYLVSTSAVGVQTDLTNTSFATAFSFAFSVQYFTS